MSTSRPPTRRATIVVSGEEPEHADLRDHMVRLADEGLLGALLWVPAERVPRDPMPSSLADVHATQIASSDVVEVELLEALGAHALDVVCVVVAQLVPRRDVESRALADAGRRLVDLLRPLLPRITEIVSLNLIVPVTDVDHVDPGVLIPAWTANVVVSPEDRASDAYANVTVKHPGNFIAHAALHVAIVGGLWLDLDVGPFDDNQPHSADGSPDPVVVRGFARVVRSPGVVDRIARHAIGAPSEGVWPIPDAEHTVAARQPQAVLAQALNECGALDGGVLRFKRPERVDSVLPRPVGVVTSVGLMLQYFWRTLRRHPDAIVETVRQNVQRISEESATSFNFSGHSLYVARFRGEYSPRERVIPDPSADDVRREASRIVALLGTNATVGPTPVLWQSLRRLCFGLVDATPLGEGFTTPRSDSRVEVITDVATLVPSPALEGFLVEPAVASAIPDLVTRKEPIRVGDSFAANRVATLLEARATALEASASDAHTRGSPVEAHEFPGRIRQERRRLGAWTDQQRSSLLWRLTERVGNELERASLSVEEAAPIVHAGVERLHFETAARSSRRMRRWWALLTSLLILVVLGAVVLGGSVPLPGITLGIVVIFAGYLITFRSHLHTLYRFEEKAEGALAGYQQAVMDLSHGASEVARLATLYIQMLDWVEVIGWTLHQPWLPASKGPASKAPASKRKVVRKVDPEPSAARAFRLAGAEPQRRVLDGLGLDARKHVVKREWVSEVYEATVAIANDLFRLRHGLDATTPVPSADNETDPLPNGAREILVGTLREGTPQRASTERAIARVAQFCADDLRPEILMRTVIPVGELGSEPPEDLVEFVNLRPPAGGPEQLDLNIWDAPAQVRGAGRVIHTDLWVPSLGAPAHNGEHPVAVHELHPIAETHGAYMVRAIRLDRSERCAVGDYSLFVGQSPANAAHQQPGPDAQEW